MDPNQLRSELATLLRELERSIPPFSIETLEDIEEKVRWLRRESDPSEHKADLSQYYIVPNAHFGWLRGLKSGRSRQRFEHEYDERYKALREGIQRLIRDIPPSAK